jgi:non-ribosomal peptide synthetase component E (peptide arylation enzyme)
MGDTQSAHLLTLLNAPMVAAYTAAGFWGNETIYHLAARHARTTPQAYAVRDRHRRLSYAELVAAADRLAACLAGHGICSGQRVAAWLPSRVETAITLLACSRNGYVCCPSMHRDHRVGETAALVDRMRATALIAQPRLRCGCRPPRHLRRIGRPRLPALHLERRPSRRHAVRRIARAHA